MKHKVDWGPGWRFSHCEECDHRWQEFSRHCQSPSTSFCSLCYENWQPIAFEEHYEWETDISGNLREEL